MPRPLIELTKRHHTTTAEALLAGSGGGAAGDLGLRDLAGGDEGVDAAVGELGTVGVHTGAGGRTIGIVLRALGVVVGGAGELDGETGG